MATYKGVNRTIITTEPNQNIAPGDQYGSVKVAYDSYTSTGVLALADVIEFMTLPAGARVHDVVLASTDFGTTGDISIGWAANGVDAIDIDGFIVDADINAAANTARMTDQANTAGQFKEFSVSTKVIATISEATTAAGTMNIAVYYTVD